MDPLTVASMLPEQALTGLGKVESDSSNGWAWNVGISEVAALPGKEEMEMKKVDGFINGVYIPWAERHCKHTVVEITLFVLLYLPECREILWFSDGSAAGYGG